MKTKLWLLAFLMWSLNLKLFYILANYSQIYQIWKYSDSIFSFYYNSFQYLLEFVVTIPVFSVILAVLYSLVLFIFWLYYFKVYFYKLPKASVQKTTILNIFATVFAFLGFGCVACGQTLLSSLLLLFVSGGSMYYADALGELVMLLGILVLVYGAYRNYKMFNDPAVCKI